MYCRSNIDCCTPLHCRCNPPPDISQRTAPVFESPRWNTHWTRHEEVVVAEATVDEALVAVLLADMVVVLLANLEAVELAVEVAVEIIDVLVAIRVEFSMVDVALV